MPLAVNVAEAAPLALVVAVIDADALENSPLAPVAGAVKVTVAPDTGLFEPSLTVAVSVLKVAPTDADWPDPEVAVTEAGGAAETVILTVAAAEVPTLLPAVNWKLSAPL